MRIPTYSVGRIHPRSQEVGGSPIPTEVSKRSAANFEFGMRIPAYSVGRFHPRSQEVGGSPIPTEVSKRSAANFEVRMRIPTYSVGGFHPRSLNPDSCSSRKWRNWQTHHLEGVAPTRRAGSSPAFRTASFDVRVAPTRRAGFRPARSAGRDLVSAKGGDGQVPPSALSTRENPLSDKGFFVVSAELYRNCTSEWRQDATQRRDLSPVDCLCFTYTGL